MISGCRMLEVHTEPWPLRVVRPLKPVSYILQKKKKEWSRSECNEDRISKTEQNKDRMGQTEPNEDRMEQDRTE